MEYSGQVIDKVNTSCFFKKLAMKTHENVKMLINSITW